MSDFRGRPSFPCQDNRYPTSSDTSTLVDCAPSPSLPPSSGVPSGSVNNQSGTSEMTYLSAMTPQWGEHRPSFSEFVPSVWCRNSPDTSCRSPWHSAQQESSAMTPVNRDCYPPSVSSSTGDPWMGYHHHHHHQVDAVSVSNIFNPSDPEFSSPASPSPAFFSPPPSSLAFSSPGSYLMNTHVQATYAWNSPEPTSYCSEDTGLLHSTSQFYDPTEEETPDVPFPRQVFAGGSGVNYQESHLDRI